MNDTDITSLQSDVDDVEAHGMREVMVGLSAAAVLTGGAAAVLTAGDGPGSSGRATISADAQGGDLAEADLTTADLGGSSVRLGGAAPDAVSSAADAAAGLLGAEVAAGRSGSASVSAADADEATERSSYLGSRLDRADSILDSSVDWARGVRNDTIDTAQGSKQTVRTTARDAHVTVRSAPHTAMDTARQTVESAVELTKVSPLVERTTQRLDATIVLVGDAVRGVEGTVQTLVAQIQPAVGAGVDASTAGGWVTISAGGQELARAQVDQGRATLTYQVPSVDVPLTVSFAGGDLVHAPAITL